MTTVKNSFYVAGFFDGEGAVMLHRRKGYLRLEVALSQNTKPVLDFVKALFGGNIYSQVPKKYKKKIIYQWKVYGNEAVQFLLAIRPALIVKAQSADEAITAWQNRHDAELVDRILDERRKRREEHLATNDTGTGGGEEPDLQGRMEE